LPLLVPLLWPQPDVPVDGAFDLIALDIGQGSSILVRTRTHELVFDAGPKYSTESDAGQRVVLPLLRARGEGRLDKLVLSHRDLDHVGGAGAMLKAMPIDDLLSSLETGHPLIDMAKHATRCSAGQSWVWDGVRFDMLRPLIADYDRVQKPNAMSCVLHVSAGGRSVLLVGDIEKEQEAALVATSAGALRSDVLIVPHHGSRTSSTGAFIDAVHPRIAVFQAGYRNRFGHPAADVMERYRVRGVLTRVTPECGAFIWRASGPRDGFCQRDEARRYWHFTEPLIAAHTEPSSDPSTEAHAESFVKPSIEPAIGL
jgi:competence protein ComEC